MMRSLAIGSFCWALAAAAFPATNANADVTTGGLTGYYLESGLGIGQEKPVAGESVTASSGAEVVETHTDQRGNFCFVSLFPGRYVLRFEEPGHGIATWIAHVAAGISGSSSYAADVYSFDQTGNPERDDADP